MQCCLKLMFAFSLKVDKEMYVLFKNKFAFLKKISFNV